MAKAVISPKTYRVALTVEPSKEREERAEGNLRALTAFVMSAPKGTPLRRCKLSPEHADDFPMLQVEAVTSRAARWYTLQFYVLEGEDTDALVAELFTVFQKNGWERSW